MSIYALSSFASRLVPFALLPFLTAELSAEEYGIVATVTVLMNFASSPMFMGLTSYINVEFFTKSKEDYQKLLANLLYVPVLLCVPIILVFVISPTLSDILEIPYNWFIAIPILTLLNYFYQIPSVLFRLKNQSVRYAILEFSYSLLQFSSAYYLVVVLHGGVDGRLFSLVASGVGISILAVYFLHKMKYLKVLFSIKYIKDLFCYGGRLIPHEMGSMCIRMLDRILISGIVGVTAAGLYAVSYQVASIALVFLSVFNLAWQPFLFKKLTDKKPGYKKYIIKLSWIAVLIFTAFFVLLYSLTPMIYIYFIDEKFHESFSNVSWLLGGFFSLSIYMLFNDYLFYVKKTHILSMITTFNLTLSVGLNWLLIHKYGQSGSAISFFVSTTITSILTIYFSSKYYPMPWFNFYSVQNN